jgi:flavodoxin
MEPVRRVVNSHYPPSEMSAAKVLNPDPKVLVCWFSKSRLTKPVALVLQSLLHADLHEIKKVSKSSQPTLPDLSAHTVFIVACPVWNYKSPAAISAFLRSANFNGKPVIGLGTYRGAMGGFVDAMQKDIVSDRFIRKEGFADVKSLSQSALTDRVKRWLADWAVNILSHYQSIAQFGNPPKVGLCANDILDHKK